MSKHSHFLFSLFLLALLPTATSCLKSSYRDSLCQLEVVFHYNFPEGVEAVDGTLTLAEYNTRREYRVAVVGTSPATLTITRGFYSVKFDGIARSRGSLARVVALVEEQPATDEKSTVTLEILSQWI